MKKIFLVYHNYTTKDYDFNNVIRNEVVACFTTRKQAEDFVAIYKGNNFYPVNRFDGKVEYFSRSYEIVEQSLFQTSEEAFGDTQTQVRLHGTTLEEENPISKYFVG